LYWEKFRIFDLLDTYDRILYLDTDVVIKKDCPNIFDVVPVNKIGILNEASFNIPRCIKEQKLMMNDICKIFGIEILESTKQYNAGVMVVSKTHKNVFKKPAIEPDQKLSDQPYITVKILEGVQQGRLEVFELDGKFNCMTCFGRIQKKQLESAYIIHYAGDTAGCRHCKVKAAFFPKTFELHKRQDLCKRYILKGRCD
jgi:lipopolysaccharide biosynthesis glycosyltransferase